LKRVPRPRIRSTTPPPLEVPVLRFLGLLLAIWLVVTVVGAVVKGLFWLAVVGLLFFVASAALGWNKRTQISNRRF
jgi:Flp pilus assembly protein TadB